MDFKEGLQQVLPVIEKSAPIIGTLLGSPAAGGAIAFIANMFGAHPTDLRQIISKITDDPEAENKLSSADASFCEYIANVMKVRPPSRIECSLNVEWPTQP